MDLRTRIRMWLHGRLARVSSNDIRVTGSRSPESKITHTRTRHAQGFLYYLGRFTAHHFSEIYQDVRHGLRTLGKSPGFAAVGVVSLTVGIGMCALFFNQTKAMLRPLPGAYNPEELVALERPVAYPYFEAFREMREVAAGAAAYIGMVPFSVGVGAPG